MNNNKQQPKPENPNNQFSNTEPLTHAQRVAIANTMSNNKQGMEQLKELMTISWRQGFMNGLLAGSIICAIISTLIITIVL